MLPERSLSAQRVAEVLEEGVHIFLIYGVAAPGVLLVHGDEPGGDQGVHVVGDGGGGQADVLRQVLAAEGAGLQQLDDIQPPLVGDGLQPVGEVLGVVAVAADQLAQLVMVDAGEEVHGSRKHKKTGYPISGIPGFSVGSPRFRPFPGLPGGSSPGKLRGMAGNSHALLQSRDVRATI